MRWLLDLLRPRAPARHAEDDDPPALRDAMGQLGAVKAEVAAQRQALQAAIEHNHRVGRLIEVIATSPQARVNPDR